MEKAQKSKITKAAFGLISSIACIFALSGCGTVGGETASAAPGSTTPVSSLADAPLYVEVTSAYENTTKTVAQGECTFASTDTPGPAATKTCTINIPELTLFYSDLTFNVGTASDSICSQVSFVPFYYKRSSAIDYSPLGDNSDDKDCTGPADDIACWGGAGPTLIGTTFLKSPGLYFLPSNTLNFPYVIKSSNTIRKTSTEPSFLTNANVANNLAIVDRAATLDKDLGDNVSYVGNTMSDYQATCLDPWGNSLYHMNIIISDDDTVVDPVDDAVDSFWDWDN